MLSPELVDQFQQNGFCAAEGFLTRKEVAGFVNSIERICTGATIEHHDATRLEMEPDQEREGSRVRRIYEPCTYYPLTNTDSLAVLVYLDDADRSNGCLQVIPGVHRNGILNHSCDGFFRGQITEPVDVSKAIALEGAAGTAIFLHGMTPHASAPNASGHGRRTLILGYRAADAYPIFAGETTLHAELHVRPVRGEWCPLARFGTQSVPIPRFQDVPKSLYELQQRFREKQS